MPPLPFELTRPRSAEREFWERSSLSEGEGIPVHATFPHPLSVIALLLALLLFTVATPFPSPAFADDEGWIATDIDDKEDTATDDDKDATDEEDKSKGSFDDDAPIRRYREGELVISDFKMNPPDDRDELDAMVATQVRIHFDYRCEYGSRRLNGGAKANLTRLDVFAVMRPEESWIATKDDQRLVRHEQGHFDVAQIAAMSARLHMHEKWSEKELTGRGDTPEEAIQQLRDHIQAEMKPFYEKLKTAQKKYDEVTSHGRRYRAQRAQRELQQDYLSKLTDKWEESEWYKRERRREKYRRRRRDSEKEKSETKPDESDDSE